MVSNYIQDLFSEQPVWIDTEERSTLEKNTNGRLSAESIHSKCREEDTYWRYLMCHQQPEGKKHQTEKSNKQKFYLCDEKDDQEESDQELEEEEEEDGCYSSSSSLMDEDWYDHQSQQSFESSKEDSLSFEKSSHQLSLSDIDKPISLLSQMLQHQADAQQQEPKQLSLKRCQSKYQSLNEWFTVSS
ncbi:hypothetical protein A0J61_05761 [Choanephora cucurbitarum]|uniref:Uncharacterized protein n=1 Tax=Choanephora cucurbitarum TaxID=101091 RepID=A0A1C7NAR2_9FUNG|nr:hypothetical protein A0J61_05761 [Choanephora cucurbitarum]